MKIYTKTGDSGETGLFGGARVSKASQRVGAYGDVDELNSVLGVVCAHATDTDLAGHLHQIQAELFDLGAELARNPAKDLDLGIPLVSDTEVKRLEDIIDAMERDLEPLKTFILPGGTKVASFLHLARTTCRRAERAVVGLSAVEPVRLEVIRYLNRLSDLLFVMARHDNHWGRVADVPWLGRASAKKP